MENCNTYWEQCLQILRDNLSGSAFKTWFAPIVPLQYENGTLILQVKSQYVVEYIEENFIDLLGKTIRRVFGDKTRLEYRVLIDSASGAGSTIPSQGVEEAEAKRPVVSSMRTPYDAQPQLPDLDPQLNPSYTFRSFIAGEANKLARTAGMAIAKDPGKTIFNPLFIFGGSGVGKTHLANAIGNQVKKDYPDKRVLYVSANTFQVQYMDAVVSNKVNDFINFYQTIDLLIVDDIQYWAEKKGTQNTFFFIFNHLHQTGKQLILTSDRPPVELKGLEDRLITRFKWGLSAEITKPDFQLRRDILKDHIYQDGLEISDEIVDYIAENVHDNVRDLEGVLASLLAYSTLTDAQIDMTLTEQVVNRLVAVTNNDTTLENITAMVCQHFNVPEKVLFAKTRKREVAQARQVAMYLAKKFTDKPLAEIGLHMGNRNHATVLYAIKSVNDMMSYDTFFRRSVQQLENALMS
ncbi:MAG: chromosomal replication initiator protein DnaA [Paludibacteraceae bacterium]